MFGRKKAEFVAPVVAPVVPEVPMVPEAPEVIAEVPVAVEPEPTVRVKKVSRHTKVGQFYEVQL